MTMKLFVALALASMLAALLWYAKDYGTVDAELEQTTAQIEIIEVADEKRKQIQQADDTSVMAAIDNKSWRNNQTETLKQQAADHERELDKARKNIPTLSAITIDRMQQFASKNSVRQQLATR